MINVAMGQFVAQIYFPKKIRIMTDNCGDNRSSFVIINSVREGVEYHFADFFRKEGKPPGGRGGGCLPLHFLLRIVCKYGHEKTFEKNMVFLDQNGRKGPGRPKIE